jgi:hypothetical protein
MIDQCNPNIYGSAMLEHILPECEIGEEREKVTLEVGTKEVLCLGVGLHFRVVGQRQDRGQILLWV